MLNVILNTEWSTLINTLSVAVPVGMDAPHLTDVTSRSIRLFWEPPTTANGELTVYKIYQNSLFVREVDFDNFVIFSECIILIPPDPGKSHHLDRTRTHTLHFLPLQIGRMH